MAKNQTIRELEKRTNLLSSQLNFNSRMLESIGVAFSEFIRFLDREAEFKKYLETNKNLHKLSKEENESRKDGKMEEVNAVSTKKVRKKSDGKK